MRFTCCRRPRTPRSSTFPRSTARSDPPTGCCSPPLKAPPPGQYPPPSQRVAIVASADRPKHRTVAEATGSSPSGGWPRCGGRHGPSSRSTRASPMRNGGPDGDPPGRGRGARGGGRHRAPFAASGDGCGSSSGSRRPTPRRYARRSQAYVREAEVSPASDFPQRFPGSGRTRRRGRWWWQVGEHDGDQVLQPEDGPERLPGSPASV